MHEEILSQKQRELLPILSYFSKQNFYLARGTALALQLGHRESIDFDIFTFQEFNNLDIERELSKLSNGKRETIIDKLDEYTIIENSVKITFLRYPFQIKDLLLINGIQLANDLTIGAMKAYALGRRAKWKDYADLYVLLQSYSLKNIIDKSKEIFGSLFSEKNFLQELAYFKDIDYTETIDWHIENPPTKEHIQQTLMEMSIQNL